MLGQTDRQLASQMLRKTKIRVAQSYTVACIVKCDGLATSNVYNELISLYNELLSLKIRGKNTESLAPAL